MFSVGALSWYARLESGNHLVTDEQGQTAQTAQTDTVKATAAKLGNRPPPPSRKIGIYTHLEALSNASIRTRGKETAQTNTHRTQTVQLGGTLCCAPFGNYLPTKEKLYHAPRNDKVGKCID